MIKQYGGALDIEGVPAEMLSYVVRMLLLKCDSEDALATVQ